MRHSVTDACRMAMYLDAAGSGRQGGEASEFLSPLQATCGSGWEPDS